MGGLQGVEENVAQGAAEPVHIEQGVLVKLSLLVLLPQMLIARGDHKILYIVSLCGQYYKYGIISYISHQRE